jgi:hypothetical protein
MFTIPVLSENSPPKPASSMGIESLRAAPNVPLVVNCEYCSSCAIEIINNIGVITRYFSLKKIVSLFIISHQPV